MSWPQGAGKCQPTPQTLALMDEKNAEARNAVIEECAKVCEKVAEFFAKRQLPISHSAALSCAEDIRALAHTRPDRGGAA